MNFESCITLIMQVLELSLESGWKLSNGDNFNDVYIKLCDEGFIREEDARFNCECEYKSVRVSPLYILNLLFDGNDEKSDFVTRVGREVSEDKFKNAISYVELVKMIDKMRDTFNRVGDEEYSDINYVKFRKKYGKCMRDPYDSIKNQILSISNMKYGDLVNLRVLNPGLARKIERLYQVEKLLREYCYKIILEKKRNNRYLY